MPQSFTEFVRQPDGLQTVKIKPLSVNSCWQGKRFKTHQYEVYEKELILSLKPITLPEKPYHIYFQFGMSSSASDLDNPLKPVIDILQKKYRFNDKDVFGLTAEKIKVKKGAEYVAFKISHFEPL